MPTAISTAVAPLAGASPLFTAESMRSADRRAVTDGHLPSIVLMERAGLEVARVLLDRFGARRDAVILLGAGNNGGDGYVVGRHLAEAGWTVALRTPVGQREPAGDAAIAARVALALGLRPEPYATPPSADVICVDALLGTGATGPPQGAMADVIASLAVVDPPRIVSIDIPSGVDADTGAVPGHAVRAGLTVALHGDKVGLRVAPGRLRAGEVVVADIGMPSIVSSEPVGWLVGPACLGGIPGREAAGDKYRAGCLAVVAGSPGMLGAAALVIRGAQRAGAGIVLAAVDARAAEEAAAALPLEAVRIDLPLGPEALAPLLGQRERIAAVVVGPGLGRGEDAGLLSRRAVAEIDRPMVLDADGLWHTPLSEIGRRTAPTVITPHSGEAARALGISREEVDAGRLAAAHALVAATGHVALLKGPGTIVAGPGGALLILDEGGPELATAGSGDVLCGVIGALLAAGLDAMSAAALGAAWHARAGVVAGLASATTAGDIAEALPASVGW